MSAFLATASAVKDGAAASTRRLPSLRLSMYWTFAGNVMFAACQWGLLVAIARLGTPQMVGQFILALGVVTPVFMLANLQLRQLHVTDASWTYRRRDYSFVRAVTTSVAIFLIGIIALSGVSVNEHEKFISLVLCLSLSKGIESLSDLLYGFQQRQECMHVVGISLVSKGVMALVFASLGIWLTNSLLVGMIGILTSSTFVLLFLDVPAALRSLNLDLSTLLRKVSKESYFPSWKYLHSTFAPLVAQGFALGITTGLLSLNTQIPRYSIAFFLDDRQLGIYATLEYFNVAGNLVIAAMGTAASARLARFHLANDLRAFRQLIGKMFLVSWAFLSIAMVAAIVFGKALIQACYGSDYAEHHALLVILVGVSYLISTTSIMGVAVTSSRKFASQPIIVVPAMLITVAACSALVPRFGLYGAAAAYGVSWFTLGAGYAWLLIRIDTQLGSRNGQRPIYS